MTKLDWTRNTNRYIASKQKGRKPNLELTSGSIISFGKYKGQSVSSIIKTDKQYLLWLMRQAKDMKKNYLSFSAELMLQLIKS